MAQCYILPHRLQGQLFVDHNPVILLLAQIQIRSGNQILPQYDLFALKISQYCLYREG